MARAVEAHFQHAEGEGEGGREREEAARAPMPSYHDVIGEDTSHRLNKTRGRGGYQISLSHTHTLSLDSLLHHRANHPSSLIKHALFPCIANSYRRFSRIWRGREGKERERAEAVGPLPPAVGNDLPRVVCRREGLRRPGDKAPPRLRAGR